MVEESMYKSKSNINRIIKKIAYLFCFIFILACTSAATSEKVYATEVETGEDTIMDEESDDTVADIMGIEISTTGEGVSSALQIVIILTVIALCPTILIMLTSFTRIIIVLHFTRSALNTQTAPPNQVIIGLALFLTVFIMSPVFKEVYTNAYVPLANEEISAKEALDAGMKPIRTFMFKQVNEKDLQTMCEIGGVTDVVNPEEDIPTSVLVPSFIMSELRIAFWIGFLIYIPFLVIDMVVSSTLMSMGMMMLPPTTISMPFKILLFVLADGWNLIIVNLMKTFVF